MSPIALSSRPAFDRPTTGRPPSGGTSRTRALLLPTLLAALLGAGCPGSSAHTETGGETVDAVDVAPLLEVSIEDDTKAVQRGPELTGVLPQGFPEGLPLALPASLIDWGSGADGRWVDLLTPLDGGTTRSTLSQAWSAAGWRVDSGGGDLRASRGGVRAVATVRPGQAGTVYRITY